MMIQRNERTLFIRADPEDNLVGFPTQRFLANRGDIVPGGTKKERLSIAEILVKFESHDTLSVGTGMIRSRAASAPYAMAARMSSWVN